MAKAAGDLEAVQELKMTFTPNIPQSGQSLGQTRDAIRNNFANYNTVISVNHVAPNNAGQGKHTFAEFVLQAQSPATAASEVAIYSRTLNGQPQLCLQKQNQLAAAADIQMSRLDAGIKAATAGWTFLPGGMIMQWGTTGAVNGAFTTTYTTQGGIAFSTNTYLVLLTVADPGAPSNPITSFTVDSTAYQPTTFSGHTNRAITLNYFAIGA